MKTHEMNVTIKQLFMLLWFVSKQVSGNDEEIVDRSLNWAATWCSIPSILNANVSSERPVGGGEFFPSGATVAISCQDGFRLVDPNSAVLECKNGNWSQSSGATKPECKLSCLRPLVPNGDVTNVRTEFPAETTLEVNCNEGYRLMNKFINTLQCGGDGSWIGHNGGFTRESPECVLATCPPLPITPNSILQYKGTTGWDGGFHDGSKVSFACRQGFKISFEDGGPIDREFKCRNGMWQDLVPVACDVTGCGPPSTILHGEAAVIETTDSSQQGDDWTPFPVGTVVVYQCKTGYVNIGSFRRYHCSGKGHWTPSRLPICRKLKKGQKASECPIPPALPFARLENRTSISYPYNSAVSYVCDDGFVIEGSPNLVCDTSGRWQPRVVPVCRPKITLPDDCLKPPPSKTEASREIATTGMQMIPFLVASIVSAVLLTILAGVQLARKGCWKYFAGWANNRVPGCGNGEVSPGNEGSVGVIPPGLQRDQNSLLCCEPDRVALLNTSGCRQVLPPTYEEAIQQSGPPPSEFLYGCILPNYHRNRYRFVSLRSTRDVPHDQVTTNAHTRQSSSSTSHSACGRSSSMADSLNSTDTVTPSEVSTTVTVDTLSSTTSHPTSSTSTRAFCGSLASFDTTESDSALNMEGVPLLEEAECEQGVSPSSETRAVLETT